MRTRDVDHRRYVKFSGVHLPCTSSEWYVAIEASVVPVAGIVWQCTRSRDEIMMFRAVHELYWYRAS